MRTLLIALVAVLPLAAQDPWNLGKRVDTLEKKLAELEASQARLSALLDDLRARPQKVATPAAYAPEPAVKAVVIPDTLPGGWVLQSDGSYVRQIAKTTAPVVAAPVPFAETVVTTTPVISAPPVVLPSTSFGPGIVTGPTIISAPGAGWYGATSGGCAGGNCGNVNINYGRPGLFGRYR